MRYPSGIRADQSDDGYRCAPRHPTACERGQCHIGLGAHTMAVGLGENHMLSPRERLLRNLDWNLLYTFLVIVEESSITGAARKLALASRVSAMPSSAWKGTWACA